jgi:hypothetical protein
LTLEELTDSVFPYTAPKDRVTEIAGDSLLHPAVTARNSFLADQIGATDYLHTLQDAVNSCPNEDLPYVWLAELYLIQGKYEEAKQWIFSGFNHTVFYYQYLFKQLAYCFMYFVLKNKLPILRSSHQTVSRIVNCMAQTFYAHAGYYTKTTYYWNPFLPVLPHGVSRVNFS